MKSVIIIVITVVLLSPFLPSYAQSSSQSDNCPQGTKAEVRGADIVCVRTSNVERTCPFGTYQGKDNQGNFACRDIETNNIVDPKTGLMYDSQTGKLIQEEKPVSNKNKNTSNSYGNLPEFVPYAIVGIVILAIVLTAFQKRGPVVFGSYGTPPSGKQMRYLHSLGYRGPMPDSSREAHEIISDIENGGDGEIDDDDDDYR